MENHLLRVHILATKYAINPLDIMNAGAGEVELLWMIYEIGAEAEQIAQAQAQQKRGR